MIVGLADQDNENDEYHAPVPIVDKWMECRRLDEMGWDQRRIANAKGISQGQVAKHIGYAKLPEVVLDLIRKQSLTDSHAAEICKLFDSNNSWLSTESAMLEIIESALKKGGTAKHFADLVMQYNEVVKFGENGDIAEFPTGYYSRVRARCKGGVGGIARLKNISKLPRQYKHPAQSTCRVYYRGAIAPPRARWLLYPLPGTTGVQWPVRSAWWRR